MLQRQIERVRETQRLTCKVEASGGVGEVQWSSDFITVGMRFYCGGREGERAGTQLRRGEGEMEAMVPTVAVAAAVYGYTKESERIESLSLRERESENLKVGRGSAWREGN